MMSHYLSVDDNMINLNIYLVDNNIIDFMYFLNCMLIEIPENITREGTNIARMSLNRNI